MPAPRVSVIVPVRNRRDLLAGMLDALAGQTYRDFEVVVVDDGSTDGADEEALSRAGQDPPVRLLRSNGLGAIEARKIGVADSSGEILAFTDSDCIPDPRWLECAMRAIDEGCDMVNGLTRPTREVASLERTASSATEGLYPTCNMLYRRQTYLDLGGFDSDAADRLKFRYNERARGTGFGEDTILAWNLIRAGARHRHVPEAVVEHHVFPPDPVEWFSRAVQMAAFPGLVKEVPELRRTLLRYGFYLRPRNRVPVYLTFVSVLVRSRRLSAFAFAFWILSGLRTLRQVQSRWPRNIAWLPAEMALDGVVSVSLIVGSIRARCIVL